MEILPILRLLWRRRLPLAVGVCAAVAIFVALGGTKPAPTTTAMAWTGVALDTPKSQLLEVAPSGAATLAWRASLLTALITTDGSTQKVARRLGVAVDQVIVVDPYLTTPLVPTAMAQAAATASARAVAPYALSVFLENDSLPVISLEATAPDRAGAVALARAGVAVLEAQASSGASYSSQIPTGIGNDSKRQAFVVNQVAPVQVKLHTKTALPAKAIGGSLFVLLLTGAAVLLFPRRRAERGGPPPRRLRRPRVGRPRRGASPAGG